MDLVQCSSLLLMRNAIEHYCGNVVLFCFVLKGNILTSILPFPEVLSSWIGQFLKCFGIFKCGIPKLKEIVENKVQNYLFLHTIFLNTRTNPLLGDFTISITERR